MKQGIAVLDPLTSIAKMEIYECGQEKEVLDRCTSILGTLTISSKAIAGRIIDKDLSVFNSMDVHSTKLLGENGKRVHLYLVDLK